MKILIPFLATAKYRPFLKQFLLHSTKLFVDCDLVIVVLTDDEEGSHKYYMQSLPFITSKLREITILFKVIRHYPWPLITLFKFQKIVDSLELVESLGDRIDNICYLDSTVVPKRIIFSNEVLVPNKITVFMHFCWNTLPKPLIEDILWEHWNNSVSWRDSRKITQYCFAGFLIGSPLIFREVNDFINKSIETDLKNNVIATCHDESYFNKFIDNNLDKFNIIEDEIWEDDDPNYCQYKINTMWRVLSYNNLQSDKLCTDLGKF